MANSCVKYFLANSVGIFFFHYKICSADQFVHLRGNVRAILTEGLFLEQLCIIIRITVSRPGGFGV